MINSGNKYSHEEYHLAVNMNKCLLCTTVSVNFTESILSEWNQAEKNPCCVNSFLWSSKQAKPIHSGRSHICVILKKRGLDLSSENLWKWYTYDLYTCLLLCHSSTEKKRKWRTFVLYILNTKGKRKRWTVVWQFYLLNSFQTHLFPLFLDH